LTRQLRSRHEPQPAHCQARSLVALVPFFFAAAFTVMGLLAYAHPQPHDLTVAVVGADEPVATRLAMLEDRGIAVRDLSSVQEAQAQVTAGEVAAAYNGSTVYVASAASGTRASYIRATAQTVAGPDAEIVDLPPLSLQATPPASVCSSTLCPTCSSG
jgi:hypothetical protein